MTFKNIDALMKYIAAKKEPRRVAIAAAEDSHVIEAALMSERDGFVLPIFTGNKERIASIIKEAGESPDKYQIFHTADIHESAFQVVQLVKENKADFLMKGKLNTSDILKEVLNKETGLEKSDLLTHMTIMEIPKYHKIVAINDPAIIPNPTLEQKAKQIKAVVKVLHALGYGDDIKVVL